MMNNPCRRVLLDVFHQMAVLVGVSILLGFVTIARTSASYHAKQNTAEFTQSITITTQVELEELLTRNEVVCIDARSSAEYDRGHIKQAISVPLDIFDQTLSHQLDLFTRGKNIVVYCGNDQCSLSHLLASKLSSIGIDRVSILAGGWESWKSSGSPIES